jgi:hypothetical protein
MTDRIKQYKALGRGALTCALATALIALMAASAQAQTTHHAAASKSGSHSLPPLPAPARPAAPVTGTNQQVIYGGQSPDDGGITVAAWGGGTVAATADQAYMQGHSLKIVTKGPYQGGQILFANPVALGNVSEEKNRYLQLVISVAPAPGNEEFGGQNNDQMTDAGPAAYWGQSGPQAPRFQLVQAPGAYPPGFRPGGMPPGYGGGPPMGYPGPGGFGPPGAVPNQQPGQDQEDQDTGLPIKQLHLILQLANGSQTDVMRPVPQDNSTGWIRVALPLSALSFPGGSSGNAQLKSMVVAGDLPATIYVGEIRLIDDNTPITAIPPDEQDVAANDEVQFQGSGDGGASSLKYTWDFNTKGSFVPDAEGQSVTHQYPKSGDYKVTLMVSDLDGIKKPATVTTTVHVEE